MPTRRRQALANDTPYKKVLSALLKPELIRLCEEFHLPTPGNVAVLRTRLKDHLSANRDALLRDPRYTALFPGHRRANQRTPTPPPSSPALSYRTPSPAPSFGSWHGIQDQDAPPPDTPAQSRQHSPHLFIHPEDFNEPYFPPPAPSAAGSGRSLPLPMNHVAEGRECHHLLSLLSLPTIILPFP